MTNQEIPELYTSLLPAACRNELDNIKKRKASASLLISTATTTDNFVAAKLEDAKIRIEYTNMIVKALKEATNEGILTREQCRDALVDLEKYMTLKTEEILVLKRQKKILKEDFHEIAPKCSTLEDAYICSIMHKTMAATANTKKSKFDQSALKTKSIGFYLGGRQDYETVGSGPYDELFCHLTGWFLYRDVKAAHIVPKSLQSDELTYLFGVSDIVLDEPRNCLLLYRTVKERVDSGVLVFVPLPATSGEATEWKCVLTDKSMAKNLVYQRVRFRDLDGKKLQFLSSNRPAKRYLYFRFVITYLHCKNIGTMDWVKEVEQKGMIWASPGPYLRQSVLVNLAGKISDHYLPGTLIQHTTFEAAEGSTTRSSEDEEDLTLSLAARVKTEKRVASELRELEDEDTDSEDG